jgi:hypothetical protein
VCYENNYLARIRSGFYFPLRKAIGNLSRNALALVETFDLHGSHIGPLPAHMSRPGAGLGRRFFGPGRSLGHPRYRNGGKDGLLCAHGVSKHRETFGRNTTYGSLAKRRGSAKSQEIAKKS